MIFEHHVSCRDQSKSREYMDKVKQLEKYIEPLRRMITKIGTEDQVGKYLVVRVISQ